MIIMRRFRPGMAGPIICRVRNEKTASYQKYTHLCIIRCTGQTVIRMLIILPSGKMVFISCSMVPCSVSVWMQFLRHSRLELMQRWNRMKFIFMTRWEESFRRMLMEITCMKIESLRCPAIGLKLFRLQPGRVMVFSII